MGNCGLSFYDHAMAGERSSRTMKTLLLSALLVAAALTASHAADSKKLSPMAKEIANKTGAEFDAAFLGLMILHHRDGEPMWALAREKSSHKDILEMEKRTTPKEKSEIELMTGWLKERHDKTPADFKAPEASKEMMAKDMAALKAATGKEFDQLFAKKMAHHHMGGIQMAELAVEKAQHSDVKQLATEIAASQTKDKEKLEHIAMGHN
jgi:uncharacterized protein (DUF305 family)